MTISAIPKHASAILLKPIEGKHTAKIKGVEIGSLGEGSFKKVTKIILSGKKGGVPKIKALAKGISQHTSSQVLQHECKISKKLLKEKVPNVMPMRLVTCKKAHHKKSSAALMKFCAGGDLCTYLDAHKGLPIHERMRLADELAVAVDGIHKQGLCHLDLKQENVFIKVNKVGIPHILLGDFGETQKTSYSTPGCGTFPAPEMYEASMRKRNIYIQPSLDQWALGSILMSLKHGIDPLRENNLSWGEKLSQEKFHRTAEQLSIHMHETLMHTGEETDQVIAQLLSVDPTERPSAERVHQVFQTWLREHSA